MSEVAPFSTASRWWSARPRASKTRPPRRCSVCSRRCCRVRCMRGLCALSGPSFAREVARGMPTAVTAASANPEAAAGMPDDLHDVVLSCLHERRRGRGRARRCGQERHRHRRRRERRARIRSQQPRGTDHPRNRRDRAPRRAHGRRPAHARRIGGDGGSGPYLHRRFVAQSQRRDCGSAKARG